MADLTDERIAELVHWTSNDGLGGMPHTNRALVELQGHRTAKAANAERIRVVVAQLLRAEFGEQYEVYQEAIANSSAEQLATPAVMFSAADVHLIDRALAAFAFDYKEVPHDDIARIRKILAAHGAKP